MSHATGHERPAGAPADVGLEVSQFEIGVWPLWARVQVLRYKSTGHEPPNAQPAEAQASRLKVIR